MSFFSIPIALLGFIVCGHDFPGICEVTDSNRTFVESDGVLLLEAEATVIPEGWEALDSISGFTGSSYLEWTGGNFFGEPGNGLLSYRLKINTTGTYRFRWRSRIIEGDDVTESNDGWLRFPDAHDYYGQKEDGSIVYPKGTGKTPNPEGAGKDGWFKVYQNQLDKWSVAANTSDNDPHSIFVRFDEPGIYRMELSGRSNGFGIDRVMLNEINSPVAVTDPSMEVSEITCRPD
ncbi:MAG: hypothetical protein AAGA66_11080 [Bacteroidota bacterium]